MFAKHACDLNVVRNSLGAAIMLAAMSAAGCQSPSSSTPQAYAPPTMSDDEFSKSANRPPTAHTLHRLSVVLAAQHKDEECEGTLRNGIQRFPDYMPFYSELAQLQVRQRKLAAAMSTLKDGLAIQPKDSVLLNDLGMCHMLNGEYDAAAGQFLAASEASPDNARYTANLAMATAMCGRYDEALSTYMRVAKPAHAHYNVAVAAEARNDMDTANREYAAAASLDPWCVRKNRTSDEK